MEEIVLEETDTMTHKQKVTNCIMRGWGELLFHDKLQATAQMTGSGDVVQHGATWLTCYTQKTGFGQLFNKTSQMYLIYGLVQVN